MINKLTNRVIIQENSYALEYIHEVVYGTFNDEDEDEDTWSSTVISIIFNDSTFNMFISEENAEKDNGAINVLTKDEFQSLKDLFCSDSVSINVIGKSSFLCMKTLESKSIEYRALNCNHIHSVNLSERIFIDYYTNDSPDDLYRYYIINSPSNGSAPPPAKDQGNSFNFITLSDNNFNKVKDYLLSST